jgi:YVTN family beta-propeller protein
MPAYNPLTNEVYCPDYLGEAVVVIDCARDSVVATVALPGMRAPSTCCLNPQNNRVYTTNHLDTNSMSVIDCATHVLVTEIRIGGYSYAACHNPTDNTIYCANRTGNDVHVVDCNRDSVVDTLLVGDLPVCVAANPMTGRVYCAGEYSGILSVIDVHANRVVDTVYTWTAYPSDLCCNPLENKVYSSYGIRDRLIIIDGVQNRLLAWPYVGDGPGAIEFVPALNRVYVAAEYSDSVAVIDGATDSVDGWIAVPERPRALCYGPTEGELYCACSDDSVVAVIDVGPDTVKARVPAGRLACALAYNPVARKVYCVNTNSHGVTVIDAVGDSVLATLRTGMRPKSVCVNTRDNKVYVANDYDHTMSVIDGALDSVLITVAVGGGPKVVGYDSAANKVYCLVTNVGVIVFDGASDTVVARLGSRKPTDIAFDETRNRAYVADNGTSRVWAFADSVLTGIGARPAPDALGPEAGPTIIRGVLLLPRSLDPSIPRPLLDISGRKVLDLHPGANDVRSLPAGVYFVHSTLDTLQSKMTKVVIQK